MKSITLVITANLISAVLTKTSLMNHQGKVPIVEGFGFKDRYLPFTGLNIGLGSKFQGDLYMGYQTDLFYLDSTTNYLVANPSLYVEVGVKTQIDFILPFLEYSIRYDFEGFRYNPFELTFMWALNSQQPLTDPQYCTAL